MHGKVEGVEDAALFKGFVERAFESVESPTADSRHYSEA
jgi:hypothetical protein